MSLRGWSRLAVVSSTLLLFLLYSYFNVVSELCQFEMLLNCDVYICLYVLLRHFFSYPFEFRLMG